MAAGHGLALSVAAPSGRWASWPTRCLEAGGEAIGVIPQQLVDRELAHRGLTDLRVVGSMHERKALMAALADAFVALPGGFGTLDELVEIITWRQLGLHSKPIGLLDAAGSGNRSRPGRAPARRGFPARRPGRDPARRRRRAAAGTAGLMLVAPWTSRFHGTGMEAGPGALAPRSAVQPTRCRRAQGGPPADAMAAVAGPYAADAGRAAGAARRVHAGPGRVRPRCSSGTPISPWSGSTPTAT